MKASRMLNCGIHGTNVSKAAVSGFADRLQDDAISGFWCSRKSNQFKTIRRVETISRAFGSLRDSYRNLPTSRLFSLLGERRRRWDGNDGSANYNPLTPSELVILFGDERGLYTSILGS